MLTELGYYLNIADGLTGPRTIDAVRRFQAHAGVNPDGVLGHHTFALLRAALIEHRPRRPLRVMVLGARNRLGSWNAAGGTPRPGPGWWAATSGIPRSWR